MDKQGKRQYFNHFIAGLSGSLLSITVCHPLEIARTRLNLQSATISIGKYNGFFDTLVQIMREEGFKGFYKGYQATAVAVPLFNAFFFPIYKYNKEWYSTKGIEGSLNHLLATITTGFVCDFLTNPLWLIRTRMQTQYLHDPVNIKYKNVPQALILVYQEEGFLSLYKGLSASFMGLSHVAVQFPVYEKLKAYYGGPNIKPLDILKSTVVSKLMAVLLTYPHVVIRTRLHDNKQKYQFGSQKILISEIIKGIYLQDGVAGFYKGLIPDIIRVLPMSCITFLVYEVFSRYLNS
ncbi:hypothetical protein pb186bvf_013705 [Paramecium bursaria]